MDACLPVVAKYNQGKFHTLFERFYKPNGKNSFGCHLVSCGKMLMKSRNFVKDKPIIFILLPEVMEVF